MTMPPQGPPGPQQNPQQNPQQGPPPRPQQAPGMGPAQPHQPGPHQPGPQQPFPQQQFYGQPQRTPAQQAATSVALLGLVSLLGVILGLSISENDRTGWDSVNAWGGLAVAGAALTLAPALARAVGLTVERAWQVAACGAAALILFWVLFTLPEVGSNTSLVTTIGVAAGVVAVWLAPGRASAGGPDRSPRSW